MEARVPAFGRAILDHPICLLLAGLAVALAGCEGGPVADDPTVIAGVNVAGRVTDSSRGGVGDARITVTMHDTDNCGSEIVAGGNTETRSDGRYDAGAFIEHPPGSEVQRRAVCLEVRAEPPADRPDLGPASRGNLIATLRSENDLPFDRVEVDLTLPAGDGG